MDLHYCLGTPPPSELRSIKLLNTFEQNTFDDFVDCVIESFSKAGSKSKEISLKACLGQTEYQETFKAFKEVVSKCRLKALNSTIISTDLCKLGLKQEYADSIAEKIIQVGTQDVLQTLKGNQLLDLQWKFGVASSGFDGSLNTFIDLYLTIGKKGGYTENVELELTLTQFYKFLASIERAHSLMQRYNLQ